MLVFKYTKTGAAAFLSHLDTMRHIMRTMRRAEIEVRHSEGFNPHMQIHMTPPLPLGLTSMSEYCTVDTSLAAEDFLPRFNLSSPASLKAIYAVIVEKNPNLAGVSYSAEYKIRLQGLDLCREQVLKILDGDRFDVEYYDRAGQRVKDVRKLILALSYEGDALIAKLRTGNENLRADRFAYNLARIFDLLPNTLEIVKRRHFVFWGNEIFDIDEILQANKS